MGKRRKEGQHLQRDRYDEDDDDINEDEVEQENNLEREPLKPEEIASIKSRKKLIATRRVATNGTGQTASSTFSPFSVFNATPAVEVSTDNKPSVFSGFKGFTAFKSSAPMPPTPLSTNTTNSTSTSTVLTVPPVTSLTNGNGGFNKPPEAMKSTVTTSMFSSASNFNPNFSDSSSSSSSLFNNKPIVDTPKPTPTSTPATTTPTTTTTTTTATAVPTFSLFNKPPVETVTSNIISSSSTNNTKVTSSLNHSNICETELNFMNDLNDLYERYYGSNKRSFSLSKTDTNEINLENEVLEEEEEDGEVAENKNNEDNKQKNESKKKYAYLLAELNKHCSKWISKHVEENPLVILTPVFVDYFAYLILLEEKYFPSTFTKKEKETVAASIAQKQTLTVPTNGMESFFNKSNPVTTNGTSKSIDQISASIQSHSSPNLLFDSIKKNGVDSDSSHKHLNGGTSISGFRFGVTAESDNNLNGTSKDDKTSPASTASSSQEEKENKADEKELEQSSKTFASLISKSQQQQSTQFNPISLTGTSAFMFKSTEKPTETVKKDATLVAETSGNMQPFKFGSSPSSANVASGNLNETKPVQATDSLPKLSFFSSATSTIAPTFSFGDSTKKTTPAPSSTITALSSQTIPSTGLFSKNLIESTNKPVENQPVTTAPVSGGFFSSLNKNISSTVTASPTAATLSTTTLSTNPSSTTFSSLLNSSTTAGSSSSSINIFKSFGSSETTSATGTTPSIFSSLSNTSTTVGGSSTNTPFFNFQSNLASKPSTSLFGTNSTFGKTESGTSLFNTNSVTSNAAEGGEADEEEYEPPKPEVSEVKEDGAVYNKRIKLYYFNEKEQKFCDRGIGNLYLKPISNGESTQLIIRADNSLANILLNVKLSKIFPITKIGVKDVSYICVPNPVIPNVDTKAPCKFLFKVKSEDDAKELLDKLNELKK